LANRFHNNSNYTSFQTTQVSGQSEDQIRCLTSVIKITVSPNYDINTNTSVTVSYDSGTQPLKNPTLYIVCDGSSGTNSATWSLSPGGMNVISINETDIGCSSTNTLDYARVSLTCTGPATGTDYTVTAECEPGEGCGL
jgi:hypothetical protein